MLLVDILTLTVAGMLAGNEFAVAAFVHPTLYHLSDQVHRVAAAALARVLGRWIPFWYGLTLLLAAADAWMHVHRTGHWPLLIVLSAVLWALAIVVSIAVLVPINNRVAALTVDHAPDPWKRDRQRWDTLHRWRVLLLTAAFVLLATGLLTGR